jgi:hypothetical protein
MKNLIFVLFLTVASTNAHKYKTGMCPPVEAMQNFDMEKVILLKLCGMSQTNDHKKYFSS